MEKVTSREHKKHADIKRPRIGNFGRFELGMIGAPCNIIHKMVEDLSSQLSPNHHITYIDADHHASEKKAFANLTDKISHHRLDFDYSLNDYDQKILAASSDIIFVNANHFKAQKQIVFCAEKKRDSLERKLDRLTDVRLFILDDGIDTPYEFLKKNISNYKDIPIFKIDQFDEIAQWIRAYYKLQLPIIKGLVLAGGKSQRMGETKALLNYYNQPQVYHACQQLQALGIEPTISCRSEQAELFNDQYPLLFDTYMGLGPFGAIVSAFRSEPNCAWIVIACDQPLLTSEHLSHLIQKRQTSKVATCYHNPETNFPEPLITIWEPKAYPRLLSFLSMGYSCPRKVLINSDINELHVDQSEFMINANTPEERDSLLARIEH